MKVINRIVKIPFKFIYQIGSSPIKFVYNKQKKLIKIISPSNVKIVGVKISRAGKKIIVTIIFIVSIINGWRVLSEEKIENSFAITSSEVYESCIIEFDNLGFKKSLKSFKSPSPILDSILKLKGGSYDLNNKETEKLVKSILAKSGQSSIEEVSLNKFLKRISNGLEPVLTNQNLWRILAELKKPHKFTTIQSTDQSTISARSKGFEKVRDDFESRLTRQKILNEHDSKLFRWEYEHIKKVNRFNKMLNLLNPLGRFNNCNNRADLNKSLLKSGLLRNKTNSAKYIKNVSSNANFLKFKSFGVGKNPKIMGFAESSDGQSNITLTPFLFSADSVTGNIQNINTVFNQFKQRMTQIGNQYIGKEREYFFKQLNHCGIDRFKAWSTEKDRITIYVFCYIIQS
jgi:hypothetical protein